MSNLLLNASADGNGVLIRAGNYIVSVSGTFGGTTAALYQTVNGVDSPISGASFTAAGQSGTLALASGVYKMKLTGGTPSGMNASIQGLGSNGNNFLIPEIQAAQPAMPTLQPLILPDVIPVGLIPGSVIGAIGNRLAGSELVVSSPEGYFAKDGSDNLVAGPNPPNTSNGDMPNGAFPVSVIERASNVQNIAGRRTTRKRLNGPMFQGAVVARLMASTATIATIGDSRDPTFLDVPKYQKGGTDLSVIAAAISLQKYTILGGFGQSGKRVDEYLASLPTAVALSPGVIFGWSFLNSIGQDYPTQSTSGAAAAQLWIDAYKNQLKPAGIRLVLCSEIGQYGMALVRRDQCDILNSTLQAFAATDGGFNFVDLRPVLCTSDRIVDPQYCYDASPPTHLNEFGAFKAAALVKAVYDQIMPTSPGYTLQANGLPLIGNFTQLLSNPLFATTTGGSTTTGATGTFAGSCTFNKTGASAALAVTSAAASVVLAGTFGAQGDNVRMSQTALTANWNSGDKVRAVAIVNVASPVNLAGVQLSMVATGDSVATTYSDFAVTQTFRGSDGSYRALLMTQEYVIPAYTTKNSLVATVTAVAFGAGGATVTVEQIGILKNNS